MAPACQRPSFVFGLYHIVDSAQREDKQRDRPKNKGEQAGRVNKRAREAYPRTMTPFIAFSGDRIPNHGVAWFGNFGALCPLAISSCPIDDFIFPALAPLPFIFEERAGNALSGVL